MCNIYITATCSAGAYTHTHTHTHTHTTCRAGAYVYIYAHTLYIYVCVCFCVYMVYSKVTIMYVYITAKCIQTHNTHNTHTHTTYIPYRRSCAPLQPLDPFAKWCVLTLSGGLVPPRMREKCCDLRVVAHFVAISATLNTLSFVTEASWPTRVEKCGVKAGERRGLEV